MRAMLMEELQEAKAQLHLAEDNFNNATVEYFEVANEELTNARERVSLILRKIKLLD